MAGVVGNDGIHAIRGFLCDLCGRVCDPAAEELNALDCTYANCPKECAVYHQDCVERYLKQIRLEKNRKTGFRCPRGTGKGTKYADAPCPGKIDKSHPIHIRSDASKKRRKAQMPPPPEPRNKPEPKAKAKPKAEEPAKPARAAAAAAPPKAAAKPSKEEVQRLEKAKLQAAAAALRRDMGLPSGGSAALARPAAPRPASRECQTLDEWEAARGRPAAAAAAAAAVPNAWAAGSKPAAAAPKAAAPSWGAAPSAAAAAPAAPTPARRVPIAAAAAKLGPSLKLTRAADAEQRQQRAVVGGEAASPPADEGRLTKAQRKNKRRAERKAQERESVASVASTELVSEQALGEAEPGAGSPSQLEQQLPPAIAELPSASEASEQSPERGATPLPPELLQTGVPAGVTPEDSLADDCAQALMLFRAQGLVRQLRALGFPEWQCVPAVVQHGADLDAAVGWMLEGRVASEEDARRLLGEESALPPIDVAPELARLDALAAELRLDARRLQQQVVTYEGDLEKACASLFEESLSAADASEQPAYGGSEQQQQGQGQQQQRQQGQEWGGGGGGLQSEFMHLALSEPAGSNGWQQQQQQQQTISNGRQQDLLPSWGAAAAYAEPPAAAAAASQALRTGGLHTGSLHSGALHSYGLAQPAAPSQARPGAPPGYAPPPAATLQEPHWSSQPAQETGDLDIDNLLASLIAH